MPNPLESDLDFIAKETFPGIKLRRFSLNQKQRDRLKERDHYHLLFSHLKKNAQYWIEPRYRRVSSARAWGVENWSLKIFK